MEILDDRTLFERTKKGDKDAFTMLYEKHKKVIWMTAWCALNNRQDAEDIVQEVFLQFWEKCGGITLEGSLRSYLCGSARNQSYNLRIKKRSQRKRNASYAGTNSLTETQKLDNDGWIEDQLLEKLAEIATKEDVSKFKEMYLERRTAPDMVGDDPLQQARLYNLLKKMRNKLAVAFVKKRD
jgi:RNA polymerase sigma-70 factor (ECF subfamily)